MIASFGTIFLYVLLFISLYFEVFLLVTFLERHLAPKKGTSVPTGSDHTPSVAIVVPCFNEENTIAGTLHSLLALHYPADKFGIIVVDDGSTDGTLAAARAFESDARIRVYSKENGGKHSAMNYALSKTNAELIGCLDADSIVASDALQYVAPIFNDLRIAAVTPGIHVKEPKNILQHMQNVEYNLSVFNRFILASLGSAFITPGPFSIFRTSIVRELGGWRHGHSTEDMEMALRMQAHGFLIANAPNAVVHTTTPRTIGKLYHQRVRWTYGFLRNAMDYRNMLWNKSYGNLGLIVLPTALISIGSALYFFTRVLVYTATSLQQELLRFRFGGLPQHFSFDAFYINTSAIIFLIYTAIILVLALITLGAYIGTGKRTPPAATPIFILFYGFLAPFWLGTAVIRAVFRTGVSWR